MPKDCSVVGFDDIPGSEFYNPPLTTVQQQLEMQGSLGAEIIEEMIRASIEKRPASGEVPKSVAQVNHSGIDLSGPTLVTGWTQKEVDFRFHAVKRCTPKRR